MLYGRAVWDPVLIASQIATLQFVHYAAASLLVLVLVGPYTPGVTLHHVLDWRMTQFRSFQGWMVVTAHALGVLPTAAAMRFVVVRAKQCLDFTTTLYLLHLVIVVAFSGLPRSASWWLTTTACFTLTSVLSEWICLQKELEEIPLTSLRVVAGPREGRAAGPVASNPRSEIGLAPGARGTPSKDGRK